MSWSRRSLLLAVALFGMGAAKDARCPDAVPIWSAGRVVGAVCVDEAGARGLTVIDLSDDWTPAALAPGPDGQAPAYRAVYRALAAERFAEAGPDAPFAAADRFLELFGVEPSFSVLQRRLSDEARHACHAQVAASPEGLAITTRSRAA